MGKYAWVPTDTALAEKKLEEKDKRIAELENEAKLHVRGCGKLVAKARAEERERCLAERPAIEPHQNTPYWRAWNKAIHTWEIRIRNLSNPSSDGE